MKKSLALMLLTIALASCAAPKALPLVPKPSPTPESIATKCLVDGACPISYGATH